MWSGFFGRSFEEVRIVSDVNFENSILIYTYIYIFQSLLSFISHKVTRNLVVEVLKNSNSANRGRDPTDITN